MDYQFIVDESQSKGELPDNVEIDAPRIVEAPLPQYPEQALSEMVGETIIAVKFQVRTDGSVDNVSETQLEESSPGSSTELFRRSVEVALREWEFTPGVVRIFEPGPDHNGDGEPDYRIQTRKVPVSVFYHVRFHFRIVDGVGQVQMDQGKP